MPRKSLAALTVVAAEPKPVGPRLRPPEGLTSAQVAAWRSATDNLPAEWFKAEHVPLLTQYARHVARAGEIEALLARLDPIADRDVFGHLAKLAAAETMSIIRLARAMRLTQQSRLKAETAANRAPKNPAPRGIEALTFPEGKR